MSRLAASEVRFGEAPLREAIHRRVGPAAECVYHEFWTPTSVIADVAAVDVAELAAFEIKSGRDNLDRLGGQVGGYGLIFDRCHAVTGRRHRAAVEATVPEWWGLWAIGSDGGLEEIRTGQADPTWRDAATMVRLLWKSDVAASLSRLGLISGREIREMSLLAMWRRLVETTGRIIPSHVVSTGRSVSASGLAELAACLIRSHSRTLQSGRRFASST